MLITVITEEPAMKTFRSWLIVASLSAMHSSGQVTTATFYGIVTDSSGARIPSATVSFVHEETGAVTKKTADSSGEFAFDFLRVGNYTVRIEAPGFKSYAGTDTELSAAQTVRRTFALTIGAVGETVTVESRSPLVNAVNAEQRESMTSAQVAGLPLARRNYTNLLSLGTGVTVSNSGGGPGHGNRDGGVRLNGLGRSGTTFTVDGTDANGNSEGRAGVSLRTSTTST
ncbi:MAG: carboxypeptidase-like regulatory domain-containing protein [Bryobacteraceae bacterium]